MIRTRLAAPLLGLSVALLCAAPVLAQAPAPTPTARGSAKAPSEVSDVLKTPRPKGGEWLGLYLMDKKVGYFFTDLSLVPGRTDQVLSVNEMVFKATVGSKLSERLYREERIYEAKPGGRLLSFTVQQRGDGGEQRLEATHTPTGLRVVRKRPGQPDEVRTLPASQEKVEDADQARVALYRKATVEGTITDGTDLESYKVTTTVGPSEERMVRGVKVRMGKALTISEKEKVPVAAYVTDEGDMVEVDFGQTMQARAESEAVAKRMDVVEVFGLTRVVLPRQLPPEARSIPGRAVLVMQGLPEKFQQDMYRQKYVKLPEDKVEVTLLADAPKLTSLKALPVADPEGGENLKATIIVESDNAEIRKLAKKLAGSDKDAYTVAKKIVTWVATNLQKDYGASADRASDVLRQMKGDCTEHSLLTVALLRAAGIPSRRVDGVVYMVNEDRVPAFYWHEWIEAYVGEWTQMDPTFNQVVADATHFGVGREGNAEITPLIGQLKVLEVRDRPSATSSPSAPSGR
ncbi:transglutaminase-like domain-containing protein [Hyalangium versicolor]|uniref:transglutaminase-like domain-containing protein n=1 Tax=Hyalangium versicolor TaxID=2861190 RepID=UPI001CCEA5D9|nr:transglutaminase-like domain-containing protein [Hyalangium versicolor]